MRGFYLYYLLSMFTGSPLMAIILLLFLYAFIDKFYFGFLPDFMKGFRRNGQIKNSLRELQLNAQNADAALSLGMLYSEKKKYQEALKYLQHPKLQDEHSASYYQYLGVALMEVGKNQEGKSYLEKALEVDPRVGYGLPYIYLIQDELKQGTPNKEKVQNMEETLERFVNTENLYKLGMVYKQLGMKEKSQEFFLKALTEYSYCPRGLKRLHRKWAILSRIRK